MSHKHFRSISRVFKHNILGVPTGNPEGPCFPTSNYSGRHHLDATNKMILYPLPHKSIEKKFFLLDSD